MRCRFPLSTNIISLSCSSKACYNRDYIYLHLSAGETGWERGYWWSPWSLKACSKAELGKTEFPGSAPNSAEFWCLILLSEVWCILATQQIVSHRLRLTTATSCCKTKQSNQPFSFRHWDGCRFIGVGLVLSGWIGLRLELGTLGSGLLDLLGMALKGVPKSLKVLTLGCRQNLGI